MKQPKKLTREQKECVSAHYMNPDEWMLAKESDFYLWIVHKTSGKIKSVDKFRRRKR